VSEGRYGVTPVYLDPAAPLAARVEAILALMTDEQKLSSLKGVPELTLADGYRLPGIDDDGVEGLHGAGQHRDATMFPQAIGLGSTWDAELVEAVGRVVGVETRARNPRALRVLAPVQDVRANPLAGRYEEGYGEDPFLCGRLGTAYAFGLKGRHRLYLRAKPELKHFFGYNHEWRRARSSSSMSCRAMHEFHLVSYRMPVEAGAVLGAMTAYNLVNGVPAIIHPMMWTLRERWAPGNFMFIPDMWDQTNLFESKGVPCDGWEDGGPIPYGAELSPDPADEAANRRTTGALLLLAGMTHLYDVNEDLDIRGGARDAVRDGLLGVSMADVDRLVRDWLAYLIRTGALDGDANPYRTTVAAPHELPEHRELALQAAREQLVLLKNDGGLLPLDPARVDRLAVLGPLADQNLRDYYSPLVPDHARVTPLAGITERLGADKVDFLAGVDTVAWRSVEHGTFVAVAQDGSVTADGSGPQPFQVYDWGHDQFFFRHAGTGRYLSADPPMEPSPRLRATRDTMVDANEWFTTVNFHYPRHDDGTRSIHFVNHVSELPDPGRYVAALPEPDHPLGLTAEAGEPARFHELRIEGGVERAAQVAAAADYAVVVVGSHPLINAREAHDRPGLALAARQRELVRAVAVARPGRTVVVIVSGYPLAVKEIQDDPNVAAIVYSSHAGQAAGTALAEVLFGDYPPAGRLTATWLVDESSLPRAGGAVDMLEYDVLAARLTYRYSVAGYVYPFGHGLTYPAFRYRDLSVASEVDAGTRFPVELTLTNTGTVPSDEVVQVYLHSRDSAYGDNVPRRQLVGFARVKDVQPGETRPVRVEVDPRDAFVWDVVSQRAVVEDGGYVLLVGASSEDIRLSARLRIRGETIGVLDLTTTPRNAWEQYTVSRGVSHWEVSKRTTLARRGGYHSVVSRRAGDHIGFTRVDLTGTTGVALRVATTTAGWADVAASTVEVRADRPDGPLLGTVTFPATGGRQDFRTASADLREVAGVRDLFLVFGNGGIYLDTVQLLGPASK
jgi:beta-glucosidase